jgi:DNA-binding CsgD family transcriptional regulator
VSQALHLADPLLQLAPAPAKVMGMIAYSYAVFLRVYGQALILAGQLEEAEATLHTARQMLLAQGVVSELWWIDLCLRRLYQLTGRPQEAATARAEARRLVQQLAKEIPGHKLRDNFRGRALNMIDMERSMLPEQAAQATYGGLTRREREVAAQLVLGKTNREIAETLVVSTKTVEAHVSRILSRLGFTSRAQIAGWAVEKKLASAPDSERKLG